MASQANVQLLLRSLRPPQLRVALTSRSAPLFSLPQTRCSSTSTASLKTLPGSSIWLSQMEQKLFDYLKSVITSQNLKSELRVAGDWVRDKLLSTKGHRMIDTRERMEILLDDMTGRAFVKHIQAYNLKNQLPRQAIGIFKSNWMNLEVVATVLYGHSVSFSNLWAERSDGESRMPTPMAPGNPRRDSQRRDLSINSLYYNIQKNQIEDYNEGQGLTDLETGILRTLGEPHSTLLHEPLRVLRALRFKASFSFQIAPELVEAMKSTQVKDALWEKVTRQSITDEFMKILLLEPEGVQDAIEQIAAFGLHDVIFPLLPDKSDSGFLKQEIKWSEHQIQLASRCLTQFVGLVKEAVDKDISPSLTSSWTSGLTLVTSFLLPAVLACSKDTQKRSASHETHLETWSIDPLRTQSNLEILFTEGLNRLSGENIKYANVILKAMIDFRDLVGEGSHHSDDLVRFIGDKRVELAYWLRKIRDNLAKSNQLASFDLTWQSAVRLAFIFREQWASNPSLPTPQDQPPKLHDATVFIKAVKDAGLVSLSETRLLLSGKEIMEILHIKPGPFIEQVKQKLVIWQLANCGEGTKEKAIVYVKTLGVKEA